MPVNAVQEKWQYISRLANNHLKEATSEKDETEGILDQLKHAGFDEDDEEARGITFAFEVAVDELTYAEQKLAAICEEISQMDPERETMSSVESKARVADTYAYVLIDAQKDLPNLRRRATELIEAR